MTGIKSALLNFIAVLMLAIGWAIKDASNDHLHLRSAYWYNESSDAENKITYYEYDGFNRLMLLKDQNGNIIKTFNYYYKGL